MDTRMTTGSTSRRAFITTTATLAATRMWDSFCGFWEKSNEIDAALLQIYCAMAFFIGI